MICYKWVIKEKDYYKPIVNNGALPCAKNIKLYYYKKGKTIKNFININHPIGNLFHRSGFHFWKNPSKERFKQYERCMVGIANTRINCTLKCFVRNKDIILQNDEQIIAKQFRILGEVKNET